MRRLLLILLAGALRAPASAHAQAKADSTRPASDSAPAVKQVAATPNLLRAAWLSDRQPIKVGDLLTIVVDEQTSANEQMSTIATGNRSHNAKLGIGVDSAVRIGPSKQFSTSVEASSRDVGQASRQGDLVAVLSVHVTGLDAAGNAQIEGHKKVIVDGRPQEVTIQGLIRPDDVGSDNTVSSARVADAVITYKGKKIGPRQGILGKILSILWP
jgi:flagellar L-ring protein precursor FlgH